MIHVVFMDLPAVFDLELVMRGEMPIHWSETYPARLGVMPRNGTDADVRWYDIDPCYVFHPMNAYGSRFVVYDAAAMDSTPVASVDLPRIPFGFHGSWIPTSVAP
jgi:carotenoid cleavage dioxygenase-like enzyme